MKIRKVLFILALFVGIDISYNIHAGAMDCEDWHGGGQGWPFPCPLCGRHD